MVDSNVLSLVSEDFREKSLFRRSSTLVRGANDTDAPGLPKAVTVLNIDFRTDAVTVLVLKLNDAHFCLICKNCRLGLRFVEECFGRILFNRLLCLWVLNDFKRFFLPNHGEENGFHRKHLWFVCKCLDDDQN
eukprot:CCRYP_006071-RC/>CCRYP_006071-RC protein AED:0.47 eAED:0.77 QI:0/0/0/1/0/0/3/0/132